MILPVASSERIHDAAASPSARAWLLPLAPWRMQWPRLAPLATPSQRRRFAGIRDPARQRDRLLAAALHRLVLSQALGLGPEALPLYRSPSGQPRLALPGLHTSLAHCRDMVVVALCEGGPVGVDVERRDTPSLGPITDLVCAAGEFEETAPAGIVADDRLLALWVRKEAVLKALGLGLARPMASFRAPEDARVTLRDAWGARTCLDVHACQDAGDCVAALALPAGASHRWIWHTP